MPPEFQVYPQLEHPEFQVHPQYAHPEFQVYPQCVCPEFNLTEIKKLSFSFFFFFINYGSTAEGDTALLRSSSMALCIYF